MRSQTSASHRQRVVRAAVLMVAMLLLLGAANMEPEKLREVIRVYIADLPSKDPVTRDKAVDGILQDRKRTVEELIPLIDPTTAKTHSDETRSAAAFLLGEFRAPEAVGVLSKALADEPGPKIRTDSSRYDVPVFTALVKIGRPAVPAMIENIETSDKEIVRIKSMDVLNHVLGGKRRVLELMEKLEARAAGNEQKVRRIKEAAKWARGHYKEDKEPLY